MADCRRLQVGIRDLERHAYREREVGEVEVARRSVLIGLNAFAMGMQMNAIRSLHVPGISTTAETATVISWISGIATWSLKAPAARRLTGVLVSTAVGAIVGDWLLSHAHTYAPVLPALVIALVIEIASVSLKQKPPLLASDNNLED